MQGIGPSAPVPGLPGRGRPGAGARPQTATIDDIRAVSDEVLDQLDQLLWASDDQYDTLISNLRASLLVLRESAVDLETSNLAVVRPLMQDAWDDVVTNYQLLTQRLDVVCPTD